jgi:tRNA modification GTPase
MHEGDTIFARATAPGRAGVAIIRISGPQAFDSLKAFGVTSDLQPRMAHLKSLSVEGKVIDSALILPFRAPNSFTGEDVIELHLHGGIAIQNYVSSRLTALPHFRLAAPGEFSRRSFLNEKMDLTEAEGLADIINADTERQRQQAMKLMSGHASEFFQNLRERLLSLMALYEAYIDFPEEEIPASVLQEIQDELQSLMKNFEYQIEEGKSAERLNQGFSVLLMGKPNAGKSTLLNALAQREVAIVTDIPGTTRDTIELFCDIEGMPVSFIDTAGIRDSNDPIEQIGVSKAMQRAKDADLILYLRESMDGEIEDLGLQDKDYLTIATKSDLADPAFGHDISLSLRDEKLEGLIKLKHKIVRHLSGKLPAEDCYAIHERHILLMKTAYESLNEMNPEEPIEFSAERLRIAVQSLSDIMGSYHVDEILDRVFSSFCIGK